MVAHIMESARLASIPRHPENELQVLSFGQLFIEKIEVLLHCYDIRHSHLVRDAPVVQFFSQALKIAWIAQRRHLPALKVFKHVAECNRLTVFQNYSAFFCRDLVSSRAHCVKS